MRASERIITELPLRELWDDRGPMPARRLRDLSAADLPELLRQGPVRFVVVDVGAKPEWVLPPRCFEFWKGEVAPHLSDAGQGATVDDFPGGYCYFAAEWEAEGSPIVVLQRCH